MKKFIKYFYITLATAVMLSSSVLAKEHSFEAKKSSARVEQAGDIVECIISASEENFYSYRAQIVYDTDLLEFESADPVYIQGKGELIRYYGAVPESPMNVPGSLVYKYNGKECGFYADDKLSGIYRSISTRMGYEPRTDGDIVLSVKLRAKKAGSSFIYLMDEQCAVMTESKTVETKPVATVFTVKSGKDSLGAVEITDMKDIAYPWRTTDAVFQSAESAEENSVQVFEGKSYDVSYTSNDVNIIVKGDGTVLCKILSERDAKYPPTVARVSAIGGYKGVNRVKYDAEEKAIIFAIEDFGEHIIQDSAWEISDCPKDSELYNAVCYLKSIGAVDGKNTYFLPKNKITKAEFIKMLVSCIGEIDNGAMCWFEDVDISSWYYKYVANAVKYGIITDNGGNFMPEEQLSAAEAEQMLQRASGIINGSGMVTLDKTDNLNRGEAAVAIQNMLWLKLK